MAGHDPRLTPARADLAAESLRGVVDAPRYAAPRPHAVASATAPLTATAEPEAELATTLLRGEPFAVYDSAAGWAWGQAGADGYVGYVPSACLSAAGPGPTHRVSALLAPVFPEPDIKTRPFDALPYLARIRAEADPAAPGFLALAEGGWVCAQHLAPADAPARDWVAEAARFLGVAYLWGGRSAAGVDCSGLVQLARQAAGRRCPRDSDQQRGAEGADVAPGAERRGDLIFWRGHVGVMLDPRRLLHANAHHMAVAVEPVAEAEARLAAAGLPVLARRRWRR